MGDHPLKESGSISPRAIFDEAFPLYLALGMSYELYWDGRPELVIPYRKADTIRQERFNDEAWLQGSYTLRAVASVLNGRKSPYPKEPIKLKKPQSSGISVKQEKAKANMLAFAERFNKKMHSDANAKG